MILVSLNSFKPQPVTALGSCLPRKVDWYLVHAHQSCWQTRRASLSFAELHAHVSEYCWAVRIWCWKLWNSMRMPSSLGWVCLNYLILLFNILFLNGILHRNDDSMSSSCWYNLRFLLALEPCSRTMELQNPHHGQGVFGSALAWRAGNLDDSHKAEPWLKFGMFEAY